MGIGIDILCKNHRKFGGHCKYTTDLTLGIGFAHSPNAVFGGTCDDYSQNWSIAFPDGRCEPNKPLLIKSVNDERISSKAFSLLKDGATHEQYGYEPYVCAKCNILESRFYFKLIKDDKIYEPDYMCKCGTPLKRVFFISDGKETNFDYGAVETSIFYNYNGQQV